MNNFKLEPFLWLHLAGLAIIPLTLEGVWLALSIANPFSWWWLDFLIVAILGILPIILITKKRPFNPFSLLIFSIYPNLLSLEQRQILTLLKNQKKTIINIVSSTVILIILWQLYRFTPVAHLVTINFPQNRFLAIIIASFLLLITNFLLQVGLNSLRILITSQDKLTNIEPYPVERIYVDFINSPIRVKKILLLKSSFK